MSDLNQTKTSCFYTLSGYIYSHMRLHSTVFVQYTIGRHHCQACEIKYGKLLLSLRSDTPEEKHKSEITENSMGKRSGVPRNALRSECCTALKWACQSLPEADEWFLTWWVFINCLLGSFAALKVFLICRAEKMRGCSHPRNESSPSPRASFFSEECVKWCHCGGVISRVQGYSGITYLGGPVCAC